MYRELLLKRAMLATRTTAARKLSSAAQVGPLKTLIHSTSVRAEAYPLIGAVLLACSGATFSVLPKIVISFAGYPNMETSNLSFLHSERLHNLRKHYYNQAPEAVVQWETMIH
ncbi:hypothetical protein L202_07614 [Cryptococcus amylolentus CBS 6039]|uniref:Uncharacterized protein n=2 Tax=Cryptococcus amylolentus TaxID=104669 RepID=A0A1E3HCU2_9TREE|nr:hypothetical protein L202_07614 [Cryptococcus amylolentus CBS 6039]ODN74162.1 hypothetical protein L202_07614 [Cryptococcus amylolentus CBS 6039]ODO00062.1 hypothetical protein I350_06686 [Cryptococcus amylolentus CBS 6273]